MKEICPLSLPYANRLVTRSMKGIHFDEALLCPLPSLLKYVRGCLECLHFLGSCHVTEPEKEIAEVGELATPPEQSWKGLKEECKGGVLVS